LIAVCYQALYTNISSTTLSGWDGIFSIQGENVTYKCPPNTGTKFGQTEADVKCVDGTWTTFMPWTNYESLVQGFECGKGEIIYNCKFLISEII